jgi:hypothetical protein
MVSRVWSVQQPKKNITLGYYKEGANEAAPNFTNTAGNRLRLQRQVN